MTGESIVRRMMGYDADLQAIRLQLSLARDVALRITSPIGGVGGGGGHSDKPLAVAARTDELTRAQAARTACYNMEVIEAARLIGQIPWPLCGDIMFRTAFMQESLRQIAASISRSEDSVRSMRRRGWHALAAMDSALGRNPDYAARWREYELAMHPRRAAPGRHALSDPSCPPVTHNDPL